MTISSSRFVPALLGTVSGLLVGWALAAAHLEAASPHRDAVIAKTPAAATPTATQTTTAPLIALAADGRVTLHVDSQPLDWVLEELRAQGAPSTALQATRVAATAASPLTTPEPEPVCTTPTPVPADLPARLQRGTEPERYDTLLRAQSEGGLPESVVRTMYETDASPRVRLLAFEVAVQAHGDDPVALRRALEAARFLPDAVIAGDAARRLAALSDDTPSRTDEQQLAPRQN